MSNIKLRDWQQECVDRIRSVFREGHDKAQVVAATGSGKSYVIAELIRQMHMATAIVIVPKIKLVEQISNSIHKMTGNKPAQYCGSLNKYELGKVTVATYQSLIACNQLKPFDIIICDENHRTLTDPGTPQRKMLDDLSHLKTRILGFTATPFRGGRPLWRVSDYWPEPCYRKTITELTNEGILVPAKMLHSAHAHSTKGFKVVGGDWSNADLSRVANNTAKLDMQVQDALTLLNKHDRRAVVWMCINQAHAAKTREALERKGETCSLIISNQSMSEKDLELGDFEQGKARHLVSVDIVKEGWDHKPTDAIVFLRPTRSVTSYIQAVGRGLRACDGKTWCAVLDYGNVVASCGALDKPFIDETGVEGTSKAARKKIQEDLGYVVKACHECGTFFFPEKFQPKMCPECGADCDSATERKLRERAAKGELYMDKTLTGTPWSLFDVVGYSISSHKTSATITFDVESHVMQSKAKGIVCIQLATPEPNTKWDIFKIAHTKKWLSKAFGLDPSLRCSEMINAISKGSIAHQPDVIKQDDSKLGYAIERIRKPGPRVDKAKPMQETLL